MYKLLIIATVLLGLYGCSETRPEHVVYQGAQRDAIINNIFGRRAIRKFTDQQVNQGQLDTLMKSAIHAPSAFNKQPWEIRVIQNQDILTEINKRFLKYAQGKEFQGSAANYRKPGFSIFHSAPTLIVIANDKSSSSANIDVGTALQNILLSADALGLGTCPIGSLVPVLRLDENKDLLKLLNIPDGCQVAINVALGHPAESPDAPIRYSDKVKVIR